MSRKVFCIGLSRTGTTSLAVALEILGFKSIHYPSYLFVSMDQICSQLKFQPIKHRLPHQSWQLNREVKAHKQYNIDLILNEYQAFLDLPIPYLYQQLDRRFPDSKFILTTRPLEKWLSSMLWMLQEGRYIWKWGEVDDEILLGQYKTLSFDPQILSEVFSEYHNQVLSYFSDRLDDLLIINIDNKELCFEVLCPFLAVEHPNAPFPYTNTPRHASVSDKLTYHLNRVIPISTIKRVITNGLQKWT